MSEEQSQETQEEQTALLTESQETQEPLTENQEPSNTAEEEQQKDTAAESTESKEEPATDNPNSEEPQVEPVQDSTSEEQTTEQQDVEGEKQESAQVEQPPSEEVSQPVEQVDDSQDAEKEQPVEEQSTIDEQAAVEDVESEDTVPTDNGQLAAENSESVEDVQPIDSTERAASAEESVTDHRPLSSVLPLEDIIEEEEVVDRETLIESVKEALAEQERMTAMSGQLEHKIAEYLISRKKTEERADPGRGVTDQEKRYGQCMAALDQLKLEMMDMQESFQLQEQELKLLRNEKLAQVRQANAEFAEYKKERALTAVHSRSGKRLTAQELEQYQSWEDRKEEEVIAVRLENIKLHNKIAKLEGLIKEKEQLAEGLHMIDFEQLKINNVDLNEKIEERNEDILKLRRKVTSTVQVLTHVKEKLQFLQAEIVDKRGKLHEMDSIVAKNRDHLTRMKQARDSLRMDNNRLKQRGRLVGHKALLRDYEERKDQNEELMSRLDTLQQRHSELSVVCEGLRRKIEQAKAINTHHL